MNARIPPDWVPVDEELWRERLSWIDYTRDGYADGVFYLERGERFGLRMDDGRYFLHPRLA